MKSASPHIFIVDDNPTNIDILHTVLQKEGYQFSFAPNGKLALELISESAPDLILLDIMMPEMDGFEVCKILQANPKTSNIPIIFITAKNEVEDIVKGLSLGGVDYITKPFNTEEVCARIQSHLKNQIFQRELILKNKRLMEFNELKNKFLGVASHDLRNPLASIQGFSELLVSDWKVMPEESIDEFLNIIHSASQRMSSLINDLLDISIIESGKLELKLTRGSLKELVVERMRIHEILAKKKGITLQSAFNEEHPCMFDVNRMSQAIDNLLSNAIKFSPPEKIVFIKLESDQNVVRLHVQDDGPGITDADKLDLFKAYKKLSAKPTANENSTGLGLMITKKIIQGHRGKLWVESQPGSGAQFTIELPVEIQKHKASSIICALIVDKEYYCRDYLRLILESLNIDVVGETSNGEAVDDLIKEKKPALLFLDLDLRKKSGEIVLADTLKNYPKILVFVVSSNTDTHTIKNCLELGAANYILKDTPIDEIKNIIKETLESSEFYADK